MRIFTITRYYLEDCRPVEEMTTYIHAGDILKRDGEEFDIATDPRAVRVSERVLAAAGALEATPNLWFSYQFQNPACDVRDATLAAPDRRVPPGHWMWNMIDLGPPREGVTFITKAEYEEHCAHMAAHAEAVAKAAAEAADKARAN